MRKAIAIVAAIVAAVPAVAAPLVVNFQAVNSTPEPTSDRLEINITFGCPGMAYQTVERGDTLDVSCDAGGQQSPSLGYAVQWVRTNNRGEQDVGWHNGSVRSPSCGDNEIARVAITSVGSTHTTPDVVLSSECKPST